MRVRTKELLEHKGRGYTSAEQVIESDCGWHKPKYNNDVEVLTIHERSGGLWDHRNVPLVEIIDLGREESGLVTLFKE